MKAVNVAFSPRDVCELTKPPKVVSPLEAAVTGNFTPVEASISLALKRSSDSVGLASIACANLPRARAPPAAADTSSTMLPV